MGGDKNEAASPEAAPHWNVDLQIEFFHAMKGHKPVGIDRHFQMIYISEKLSRTSHPEVSISKIWAYLSSLYNLSILNELESFPPCQWEREFQLNDADFSEMLNLEYPRVPRFCGRGATFLDDARSDASGHSAAALGSSSSSSARKRTRQSRGGRQSRNHSPASSVDSTPTPRKRGGRY